MGIFRPFPLPLSTRQWLYILIPQTLGAGIISGGANFAIAFAMYHAQDEVTMWVFHKSTIAGDLGVTPFIQCALSMVISSTLVHDDMHHGIIRPLQSTWPRLTHLPDPERFILSFRPKKKHLRNKSARDDDEVMGNTSHSSTPESSSTSAAAHQGERGDAGENEKPMHTKSEHGDLSHYILMLFRFIFEGRGYNRPFAAKSMKEFFFSLIWTIVQGLGIGLVVGFPLWCLAIVILGPIYGKGNMGSQWAPQAIKLVYGFILAIISNPLIALLALGSKSGQDCAAQHDARDAEEGALKQAQQDRERFIQEHSWFTTVSRSMTSGSGMQSLGERLSAMTRSRGSSMTSTWSARPPPSATTDEAAAVSVAAQPTTPRPKPSRSRTSTLATIQQQQVLASPLPPRPPMAHTVSTIPRSPSIKQQESSTRRRRVSSASMMPGSLVSSATRVDGSTTGIEPTQAAMETRDRSGSLTVVPTVTSVMSNNNNNNSSSSSSSQPIANDRLSLSPNARAAAATDLTQQDKRPGTISETHDES